MFYVGPDIHSKHIVVCVLDENGKAARRSGLDHRLDNASSRSRLEGLPEPFEICYEASCRCGAYHDPLPPVAARVVVAHPGQVRLIFRSQLKNDRRDAEKLAKLLYPGEVPAGHVPTPHVRWRELITCRRPLVEMRFR